MARRHFTVAWAALALVVIGGCAVDATTGSAGGSCAIDLTISCNTGVMNGFACTGTARPDQNPDFSVNLIEGAVCTDLGSVDTTGTNYCCTDSTTPCGYDPSMQCPPATPNGYACRPPNRPENFDPDLSCGMGQPLNGNTVFCCGVATTLPCSADTAVACPADLKALECSNDDPPNEGELGTDQSRSDAILICDVPAVAGASFGYCCFTPSQTPPGATCLQDQKVPDCPSGSFGFACTGPDTPDQDYVRIACPPSTTQGTSAEGYPASLYCCTYIMGDAGPTATP